MPAGMDVAAGFPARRNHVPAVRVPAPRHRARLHPALRHRARQRHVRRPPDPVRNVRPPVRSRHGLQPERLRHVRPNHQPVCPSPRPGQTLREPEPGRGQAGRALRCRGPIDLPVPVRRPARKEGAHPMRGLLQTVRPERDHRGHARRVRATARRTGARQTRAHPIIGPRITRPRIIARRITVTDLTIGAQGGDGSLLPRSLARPSSMS